jgi:hypothetical protein
LNAATKGLRHPRYLSVDSNTKRIVALAEGLDDDDDDDDDDDNDDDDDDDDNDDDDDDNDDDEDDENLNDVTSWLINKIDREGLYTSDNYV